MGAERLVPDDHGGAAAAAVGMLADASGVNVSHPRTVSPFGSGVKGEHSSGCSVCVGGGFGDPLPFTGGVEPLRESGYLLFKLSDFATYLLDAGFLPPLPWPGVEVAVDR